MTTPIPIQPNPARVAPPALPTDPRQLIESLRDKKPATTLFGNFEADFKPVDSSLSLSRITDALLKHPAQLVHEILHGRSLTVCLTLLAVTTVCLLGYGAVMGSFSGHQQYWIVPLKICLGMLASALICLPSLYIFSCLSGSELSLPSVAGLLLMAIALSALLLAGFAPVAWIFSQSTGTVVFMGLLHLLFWIAATHLSMQLFSSAFRFLHHRSLPTLRLWIVIFAAVVLQMTTALRPLVGPYQGPQLQGKCFFLTHWTHCMKEGK